MSTEGTPAASGGQRALAWLSIVCGLLLAVILVVFTVRNLPELAGVVVGVAVAAAGGWWLITERPPRRWIGLGAWSSAWPSSSPPCSLPRTVTGRWSAWRWC